MQTKKTPRYLVFISHEKGEHTNIVVDSAIEAWWAIQGILDDEEFTDIKSELEIDIDALTDGEDMYQEFKDGTWTTITRRDIEKPISKTIGVDGKELSAVLVGLRLLQKHGYIKEYLDEEEPLDSDEIDQLCDMLNVVAPIKHEGTLPQPLKERIRGMAEAMAVGNYSAGNNDVSYEKFMASKNVHKITSIWEPFENDDTNTIQENVGKDANNLVGFAEAIINTMTVGDMMEIISQRAVDAGAVDSKDQLHLLAIKSIGGGARDSFGHNLEDTEECFGNIGNFDESCYGGSDPKVLEYLKNASAFGISFVNGY